MVGNGIGSGKYSSSLAMHTLAVGEEEAIARGVVFVKDTPLPHKALVNDS